MAARGCMTSALRPPPPRFFSAAVLFPPLPVLMMKRHADMLQNPLPPRTTTLSCSLKQISCKTGLNPRCYK